MFRRLLRRCNEVRWRNQDLTFVVATPQVCTIILFPITAPRSGKARFSEPCKVIEPAH